MTKYAPYSFSPLQKKQPNKRSRETQYIKVAAIIIGLLIISAIAYSPLHKDTTSQTVQNSIGQKQSGLPQDQLTAQDKQLTQIIESWAANYSFQSSVSVKELGGKYRTASFNPITKMEPASTHKLYVAYAVLHDIERGKLTMQTKTGNSSTVSSDLQSMIVNSDNEADRRLGFLVGWININILLSENGLTATDLDNYQPPSTKPIGGKESTTRDYTTLLEKLQAGMLLNKTHTDYLLGLMKTQLYRERIPAGVPDGVIVADKPGWLTPADGDNGNAENDVAIVYGPKSTYILAILTNGSQANSLTKLSSQIYSYLETSTD